MKKIDLAHLRQDYKAKSLDVNDLAASPFLQFDQWFSEALAAAIKEPNAMVVATATPDGLPSARVVLLKGVDKKGFIFYTNYDSHKGQELQVNPQAALVFNWLDLERQIRIVGTVEKVTADLSETYFHSRPRGSQIGAIASPQSSVIADRGILEKNATDLNEKYKDIDIPRPENWGGFRVVPRQIEFWQGRSSRLHDRMRYTQQPNGDWKIERLAP